MTKNYFAEMMAELGFHTVDKLAVGLAGSWPCSVEMEGEAFLLRLLCSAPPAEAAKTLRDKNIPHVRWSAYKKEKGQGLLAGVLTPPSDFYAKGCLHGALAEASRALDGAGLQPPATCALCEGESCGQWAFVEGAVRAVHPGCLQSRLPLPEEDSLTPGKAGGHYLTGVLGALLGGAIAALPNWAQALSKGTVHPVLYVFIPLLAALVYRLCRGKARLGAAGGIVLGASLAVSFVLELIWFWLVSTTAAGYNISIAQTTAMYFEGHTIGLTLREMGFSLLFLMLGFFVSTVLLRRYVKTHTRGGELVRGGRFVRQTAFSVKEGVVRPAAAPAGEKTGAEEMNEAAYSEVSNGEAD